MAEKKTHKTPKGHEIPIPMRSNFMRDLKKVAKPKKPSVARRRPTL